jgi:tetratricopeptide (TPR) repeat protein
MMTFRRVSTALILALSFVTCVSAQDTKPSADKLPMSGLAPAKLFPNLCVLRYRVSTNVPECQSFCDQALGYFYSYVWMEAVRSFETATVRDPECAMAWWGLSRAFERWGKRDQATKALQKADQLKDTASHREQQLILARMQETGNAPNVGDGEKRKKAAISTIDNVLTLYDDDEEAWYCRAQLAGGSGLFGGQASAVPFYKALLRVNPLHPGANHELVHYYENARRPALGWTYAEKYIESSPGIPHPFHMQAHLATRLGRWDKTSDLSSRAIELERAYHKEQGVQPKDDHQFSHHLEILTLSLIHDGRFREARAIKQEAWDAGYRHWLPWFRLHLAERDWDEALKIVDHHRKHDKKDKTTAAYLAALLFLRQGDTARAAPEVEVLRHAYQNKKKDRTLELRLWETQGMLMCQTGGASGGLKLLQKAVKATVDNYSHHAWGNGAYYMEPWGMAALQAGEYETAEEALLEALAHDRGSVRAAMGMQLLCERQGRRDEANHYADLARRLWSRAEVRHFEAEFALLRDGKEPRGTLTQKPSNEPLTTAPDGGTKR